jgi:hypothetical protein
MRASLTWAQGGGNIGSIVLRGLLTAPELKITAIKRPGSKSTFPTAANLQVVESDLSHDSLLSIFKGNDTVISIVGATGIGEQKPYVDAAVEAGIKRFFPSEFGINGQSKAVQEMTPFFAVKEELLGYLVEKEKDGLTWTGLICGVLLDWCIANGFIGFDLTTKKADIWDDGKSTFSATNEDDLGKAVVAALRHPAETANKFVYVDSVATSQNEILAALEKVTATKWDVTTSSTRERLDVAKEALGKGDFSGALTMVKATCLGNIPGTNQHFEAEEKDKLFNDVLGIPRASVEGTVNRLLNSGRYDGSHF